MKRKLTVVMDGDNTGAKKNAKESEKVYEGLGKKVEGIGDKMRGALVGGLGVAGVGAGAAFMGSLSNELDTDKLAASMGASGQWAEDIGKIAGDLYADGFGGSLAEAGAGLKTVMQNGLLSEDATNEQIESMTATAMTFVDVLEQDLPMAGQAVGNMLRNGLAKDGVEAFDILTRGVQQGADKAGDLLETFQEYGTQFSELGLSGAAATGLMVQGLKAGARDADTIADGLKEFAILAQDGSEKTAEGFKTLGLNAGDMAAKVQAGGATAAGALDETLDRLRAMPDSVDRNNAAVALFGTKAEDLQDALFALDPSTAVDALGQVAGASDKLGSAYDNDASRIESFRRQVTTALTGMAADAIPKLEAFGRWFMELPGPVQGTAGALAAVVVAGSGVSWVADKVSGGLSLVAKTGKGAVSTVQAVYGGLGRLAGGFRSAQVAESAFSGRLGTFGGKLKTGVSAIGTGAKSFASWGKEATIATAKTVAHTAATVASKAASLAVAGAQKVWAAAQWALNAAMSANPIGLVVAAIAALVAAAVWAYQNVDWFRNIVDQAWAGIQVATNALSSAIGWLFDHWQLAITVIMGPLGLLVALVVSHWDKIAGAAQWAWNTVLSPIFNAIGWVIGNVIIPYYQTLWSVAQAVWNGISGAVSWAWNSIISPTFSAIAGGIQWVVDRFWDIRNGVSNAVSTIADILWGPFKTAFNWIARGWNDTVGQLSFGVPDWVPFIGGKSFSMPRLPTFHTGGMFSAPPGASEGLAVLRHGEQVVTPGHIEPDATGGGATYVTYQVDVTVEGHVRADQELAETVRSIFIKNARTTPGSYLPGMTR
jgi:phage-related minor tail protein